MALFSSNVSALLLLKEAMDDPAKNLAAAQAHPELGPIISKLSAADLATLQKVVGDVTPECFCNKAQ